jgi:hypothetical protein
MRDLKSNIDIVQTLAPAARTAAGTGANVNLQGYDSAVGEFSSGDWTDGTWTPKLQESEDGTTFTDVGTGDLSGAFTAVSGTAGENNVQRVGYIGSKQYLRGFLSGTGTTGMVSGFNIVRGHAARTPLS